MKLWNRGYARAALMGNRDDTINPSPAAKSILSRVYGARAVTRAVRRAKRRRRPFFRGNPLPAFLMGGLGPLSGIIGGSLGKRLEGRGAKTARFKARMDQLAALALQGSAEALAEIDRNTRQAAIAERRAYASEVLLALKTAIATKEKEAAAAAAAEAKATAAQRRAASAAEARERAAMAREERAQLLDVTGQVGAAATQALLSRGRSVRRRAPKKRRRRVSYSDF